MKELVGTLWQAEKIMLLTLDREKNHQYDDLAFSVAKGTRLLILEANSPQRGTVLFAMLSLKVLFVGPRNTILDIIVPDTWRYDWKRIDV